MLPPIDVGLLRTIADDLPLAIWLGAVPGGEVLYVNKAFEEILGMGPPADASRGNYVSTYSVHARDGSPYREDQMPYERVLRARDTIVIDDLVVHRGDLRVYLRVFARPLLDANGTITHVLETFEDISREVLADAARAEGEARLRHAQRMEAVGNLAGGIAHDFNNMLAAVKILTSHLERTEVDPQRLRLLGDIGQVVDTAAKLTHTLLRFARKDETQITGIVIADLIATLAELSRRTIDKRIDIRTDALDRAVVLGDAGQIEQVLMNLVVNARDAMPEGGRLVLRCRDRQSRPSHEGQWVVIEVEDSGGGITADVRERMFEPYFTTKTTGPIKGTGLGLATVYAIVQAHGGGIEAHDTPGGGATIRVFFPRADEASAVAMPRVVPRAATQRGTLLVIDDEPPVRRAASLALEGLGYRVLPAESGEEAVVLYREHHAEIDAVLLDMVMPGMGGRQTYVALREINDRIPVIVTSGLSLSDEAKRTMELGAQGFAPKPYDVHSLCETIEQLRRRRDDGHTRVTR